LFLGFGITFVRKSILLRVGCKGLLDQDTDIRFHDLRHTSATLLLSAGVHPKVVQERLGHSQIAVTLDVYSHILPTLQLEAADKLDSILRSGAA
jgi:integrase